MSAYREACEQCMARKLEDEREEAELEEAMETMEAADELSMRVRQQMEESKPVAMRALTLLGIISGPAVTIGAAVVFGSVMAPFMLVHVVAAFFFLLMQMTVRQCDRMFEMSRPALLCFAAWILVAGPLVGAWRIYKWLKTGE